MGKSRRRRQEDAGDSPRRRHPLAEVFGFPADNASPEATRHRQHKLCPFANRVPNCTKDKANDPLGVCSIFSGDEIVITCPVRFRQHWIIADDAAEFLFPNDATWTSLTEVRLKDRDGRSAGNIDLVLVSYDQRGKVLDFGAVEVQAVYISGNIRRPFEKYMENPAGSANLDWTEQPNYPSPDYLSSSRKRLAPQLIFKGGILHTWGKKLVVALNKGFFNTLPQFAEVEPSEAEIAWLIYDLSHDAGKNFYTLIQHRKVYTKFETALNKITVSEAGDVQEFLTLLQNKLDEKLEGDPPDVATLDELL
jgi:hypothetical protein